MYGSLEQNIWIKANAERSTRLRNELKPIHSLWQVIFLPLDIQLNIVREQRTEAN